MRINAKLTCISAILTLSPVFVEDTEAAVIVYWEQDGSDVTATWTGTLDTPILTDTTTTNLFAENIASSNRLSHLSDAPGASHYGELAGAGPSIIINTVIQGSTVGSNPGFGFAGNSLYWSDVHISQGSVGNVTQVRFNPSRDVIRFSNQTLSGMFANNFSDTLAWTVDDTGDTIRYTTGPVVTPEPSGVLLLGLGGLSAVFRRSRVKKCRN